LQQNKLIATTKFIFGNTIHTSQSFINLMAITHTYCNKIYLVIVESVIIDRFSSSNVALIAMMSSPRAPTWHGELTSGVPGHGRSSELALPRATVDSNFGGV
jgi:hypothetical protein